MSAEWRAQAETVVIGAGVIGLSLAYELLRRGRQVLVLERDEPGAGATRAAGGMLAPVSEVELEEPELIAFGQESLRRYPEFVEELERVSGVECGYRPEGTLWVATHRDDCAELDHLAQTLRLRQLDYTILSAEDVREREPHVTARVHGGLLVQQDHQVDPRRLTAALVEAIGRLGGRIVSGANVESIETPQDGLKEIRGAQRPGGSFRIACGELVLAAGAWISDSLGPVAAQLGIRAVKGQLLRLRGPRLLRHAVRTPDIYMIPRDDGELLVGGTMEEMGHDRTATAGAVMDLLRHGWELLPGIYDLELAEISVGLRPATEDQLPLIGPAEAAGVYLAAAHFRNGVLLAPATAVHLAGWIVDGRAPEALSPFRPSRLRRAAQVIKTEG